jgi:hypothetical protein
MATTTNYGWTTPDDTSLVKDGAAAIRTLGSSVDTTTKNLNPSTTLGDIEYRSSTANTNTRLGIGSTGQVLTVAAGVPSWATPASPASGLNFITRQSFSAVATADLDNVFTSTYETYQIVVEECFSTVSTDLLQLRFRYAGPSTQSADYYNTLGELKVSNTYTSVDVSGGTYANLISKINNTTNQASNCTLWLSKVGSGSRNPIGYSIGQPGNGLYPNVANIYQLTAREYTGIRLFASTGNLTATVAIYGLAKS